MAEVDLAKRDMYGYREVMDGVKTRVRIPAGTQIPPGLTDLEDADDMAGAELGSEADAALLSEDDQAAAAEEREKLIAPPEDYGGVVEGDFDYRDAPAAEAEEPAKKAPAKKAAKDD